MSLDLYLCGPEVAVSCTCACGHGHDRMHSEEYFSRNVTHNLGKMAREAGLYAPLWRPDENGIVTGAQLAEAIRPGIAALKADPRRFMAFNPENGWGSYNGLVEFAEAVLEACEAHPEGIVMVSR